MKNYIAHIRINNKHYEIQSLQDHSDDVAQLTKEFANEFGFGPWGEAMGLLHDVGKEKDDFQNYIKKTSGYDKNAPSWVDKSHAYVGALVAQKIYGQLSTLLANQIMGHHRGLLDYPDLEKDLAKPLPLEVDTAIHQLKLPTELLKNFDEKDFNHLMRML